MQAKVLAAARSFIGTPYRHQGSRRGVGCDCLGLVRGVWREIYDREPEDAGAYGADWAERGGGERLLEAARRHLVAVDMPAMRPGDVAVFRWRPEAVAKHCGIVEEGSRLIHAYEGMAVVSSPLGPGWTRRIAGVFRFPEG